MNQDETHHQIANEVGIATGMVQLALRALETGEWGPETRLKHYLERANEALIRLPPLLKVFRTGGAGDSHS
jgi:hypothetical protein